jgi:hypothetical protein
MFIVNINTRIFIFEFVRSKSSYFVTVIFAVIYDNKKCSAHCKLQHQTYIFCLNICTNCFEIQDTDIPNL